MILTKEKNEILESILKDDSFIKASSEISTAEELKELFEKWGLDLSIDEVITFCEMVAQEKQRQEMSGIELSSSELENVAGGGFLFVAGCIGLGVIAVGGLAMGIVNGYKKNS